MAFGRKSLFGFLPKMSYLCIMRKEMFIDIETSGLDPNKDSIVQLAYIYREGGKVVSTGDLKGKDIYTRFTVALNSMVDKYNKEDKIYFIAYNAGFDNEFIRQMFLKNGDKYYGSYFHSPHICVMQLAAFKFMRKNKRPDSFKLGEVCRYFNMKVADAKLHDGMYDITLTKNLYNKLIKW